LRSGRIGPEVGRRTVPYPSRCFRYDSAGLVNESPVTRVRRMRRPGN
jgi:hypothetical protein